LDQFDGAQGNGDGKITRAEFFDYYTDLSMSLPSEVYFVQMLESTWGIAEDEGSKVYKDEVMRVVSLMRNRLTDLSNNSQEEYVLKKMFTDFDANKSGNLTIDELAAMVAKLGVSVDRKYLHGLMKEVD
jgi:Ca2+-binding EF-hand superfamily protein